MESDLVNILSAPFHLVTLDYKTLMLLLVKKDDMEFKLGGSGVTVEFCFICDAIRVCIWKDFVYLLLIG